MKACDLRRTLTYLRDWNFLSFVWYFQGLLMSYKYSLALACTMYLAAMFVISASFEFVVVNMHRHYSALRLFSQKPERVWSNLVHEGVKYLTWKAINKGGKGTIRVESYNLIACERTNSVRLVQFLELLLPKKCFNSLTFPSIQHGMILFTSILESKRCPRKEVVVFSSLAGGSARRKLF